MNAIHTVSVAAYERQSGDSTTPVPLSLPEAASRAAPGLRIAVYDGFSAVEHLWRRFEPQADCTVFQNFDYLAIWQKHVGTRAAVRPAIVVVFRGSDIFAIFPLAISGRLIRRMTWLGQDLGDYLAPLLAQDFTRCLNPKSFVTLWREIRTLMQRDPRFRHDFVDLRKMPEAVGGQPNPFLALPLSRNASSAHLAALFGNWDEFYAAKRSGLKRRRDRNSRKRLAESGDVQMITPADNADILHTLDTLIRQKSVALKRKGVSNIFARPGMIDFYRDLAINPNTRDLVHLSRFDVGPVVASVALGLQFRTRYHYILASYDGGAVSRFSPGAAHLRDLMEHAIGRGDREFDFTIGDEPYKFEWSDTETKLYDLLAASTLRGWPVVLLAKAFNATKRTIKQTPVLWNAYQKIRAATGAVREPVQG